MHRQAARLQHGFPLLVPDVDMVEGEMAGKTVLKPLNAHAGAQLAGQQPSHTLCRILLYGRDAEGEEKHDVQTENGP